MIQHQYWLYKIIAVAIVAVLALTGILIAIPYFCGIAGIVIDVLICILIYLLVKDLDIVIGG